MDDVRYVALKFEEVLGVVKTINEGVTALRQELARVPKREEFDELKRDVGVIKASVRSLSSQTHNHEVRISGLEAA